LSVGYAQSLPVTSPGSARIETTFSGALKDIKNDGRGYYDLVLSVPANTSKLSLGLKHVTEYLLTAQAYTLDQSALPELVIERPTKTSR
jgi:hypothetical protein